MRLVRYLAAECDGEVQGVPRGLAQPGGEQGGGRRAFPEAGQRYVLDLGPAEGRVAGLVVESVAEGLRVGAQLVALAQQRARLDEAQRQSFGLEPEVARPVRLVIGERALHDALEQLDRGAAAESGEEDLFEVRVGGGCGDVGCRAEQERALGRRVEEFLQRGAAELQVVEDDDGADAVDERQEPFAVGPVQRGLVDGFEEVVQQVGGGALVAGKAYDPVGCQVRAVGGHGTEQGRAAGTGGAGQPHRAAPCQQPHQSLPLLLALQQRKLRSGRPRRYGRCGGTLAVGTLRRRVPYGGGGLLAGPAGLDLAAVDGIDREQEVARYELDGA